MRIQNQRWLTAASAVVLCLLLFLGMRPALAAVGSMYEAALPPDLDTAKDMCALVPCQDAFPGAKSFSDRMGQPPYVQAYGDTDKKQLLGYVMLSTDITDTPGYSGKPIVTLIGMDMHGRYVGIKVLKHSEPILLLGIPESVLLKFNAQYVGKSVANKLEVGQSRPDENVVGVDAISGATVTAISENQVITTVGTNVARQVGILPPVKRDPARFAVTGQQYDWATLVKQGSVQRLQVMPEQVGLPATGKPFIELWFGDLSHPDLARSVLGDMVAEKLQERLKAGRGGHPIFIIRTAGTESFKGSGFVRGGIYDRIQLKEGDDSFTFRDSDYLNLYGIAAAGAPAYVESGIFIVRSPAFSPAYRWRLVFLGNRVDRATGKRSFASFDQPYWLDAKLLQGGRPKIEGTDAPWKRAWQARPVEIALFALLLIAVTLVYAWRTALTRRSTHKNKWPVNAFKYTAWALSIIFVGFGVMAQPSITQVLTWFHSLLFQWNWALFLTDPFIFLFWIFIIATVFLFGRGLFCGWMCPFGSLSEAIFKIAGAIGLKRWQVKLPQAWHDRLKWLKYFIFFGLLAVSMWSMVQAEKLAEVEPFKTTFLVGITHRAWPYGLYVCVLLGLSIFIERPYCKYLCPLGASLAIPTTFRWFGLPRKFDCNSCKACAVGCGSQAIDADGRIDQRECLHCLDCLVLYTDTQGCPPLAKERKRRERDGLEITPIGRDGYFIPIHPEPVPLPAHVTQGPDPRMVSAPATPPYPGGAGSWRWLVYELRDHLWPWSRKGWATLPVLQIVGFVLAMAVSAMWVFAALGRVPPAIVIGGWFGWSVYEVLLRMSSRRYIKDGPWWQADYREAGWMDMFSYVAVKNLLIGAVLLLGLKALGVFGA